MPETAYVSDLLPAQAPAQFAGSPPTNVVARRAGAFVVDFLGVFIGLSLVAGIVLGATGTGPHHDELPTIGVVIEWIILPLLGLAWWVVPVGLFGATGGQRIFRLRVVGVDARPIGVPLALARCGAAVVAAAPLGIGFLWALAAPEHRSWVDRMTRTWIVDARLAVRAPRPLRHSYPIPPPQYAGPPTQYAPPQPGQDAPPQPTAPVPPPTPPATEAAPESPPPDAPAPIDLNRVAIVASVLEDRGHLDAAAPLLGLLWKRTGDRDIGHRAAWTHGLRGDYRQSLLITDALIAEDATDAEAFAARAAALNAMGSAAEAVAAADHACELAPASVHALFVRSFLHIHAKEFDAARAIERRLTSLAPADRYTLFARTTLATSSGDRSAAIENARQVVAHAPDDVEARVALARSARPKSVWRFRASLRAARAQLPLMLDVLRAMPQCVSVRRELRAATRRFKGVVAVTASVTLFASYAVAVHAGQSVSSRIGAIALIVGVAAGCLLRHWRFRTQLDPELVHWIDYLADQAAVENAAKSPTRRRPRKPRVAAPGVLSKPSHCWCETVLRLDGVPAVEYARHHLVESDNAGVGGVLIFTCPLTHTIYVGFNGDIVGSAATLRRVTSLQLPTPPTADNRAPGMYL